MAETEVKVDEDLQAQVDSLVACLVAERTGPDQFEVTGPDSWNAERVFGGMVVAQALGAALQTVDPEVPLHSLHGYFLRPSVPGRPVEIDVDRVRDGRSFTTRETASVVDGKQVYRMMCSFHADEDGEEYQLSMPDDVGGPDTVPPSEAPIPFDIRELGSTPKRSDGTYQSTRRVWFRAAMPLPDDPMIHTLMLAYLSDMTGAAFRPHNLGTWGTHTDASLDHAVWFHRPARADEWLLFDLQALVNFGGRSTVRGTMYTGDGMLVLSMAQEILIRPLADPEPQHLPGWANIGGDT